jgi:hypothetical protein
MKIACLTAMYKRPEVTAIFYQGMKRLGIPVYAAVSGSQSIMFCRKNEIPYIVSLNQPLGNKWNEGLRFVMNYDWTHLMISGDDDVYFDSILETYEKYKKQYYIGFNRMFMIKPSAKAAFVSESSHKGKSMGAGRLFRRELIEDMLKHKTEGLWDNGINKGLDGNSHINIINMLKNQYGATILSGPVGADIKTDQNLWSYERVNVYSVTTHQKVKYNDIVDSLPEKYLIRLLE